MNPRPLRLCLALALSLPPPALLAAPPGAEMAEARALVERLTLDRAASLAAANRRAAEREQTLFARLEAQDKQLRTALAGKDLGETEAGRLRAELARVTQERQRLVAELEHRDSAFATELAEYRRLVAALADTPSPARRQALARYAEGDRLGAFPVLEALTQAEESARAKAAALKAAAEYRQLATLAAEMRDRGEKPLREVLHLWAAAAARDAGDHATWIALARLRQEAGQTAEALADARRALRLADAPQPRARALAQLGELQQLSGDSAGARQRFEESLRLRQTLAQASPDSPAAQRDLSIALEKLADAQLAAGEAGAARAGYLASLDISRRLAASGQDPEAPRDVRVGLERLGDAQQAQGDLAGARQSFDESLQRARQLAAAAPRSPRARADLAVALERLGNLELAADAAARALAMFQESLRLRRQLAEAEADSALARRALSVSLNRLAAAQDALAQPAARHSLEESLGIRRALAAADPASFEARRDLAVSHWRLGEWLHRHGDATAAAHLQASVDAARQLAAADPAAPEPRQDLAGFLETQGQSRLASAPALALANLTEAVQLRRGLGNPAALARSLTLLAQAQRQATDPTGAIRSLQEATRLSRALAARGSSGASGELARQLALLGNTQLQQPDLAAARQTLEEGAALALRLAAGAQPVAVDTQRLLAISLARIGRQPGSGASLQAAADLLAELQARGALPADDQPLLARLQAMLAERRGATAGRDTPPTRPGAPNE